MHALLSMATDRTWFKQHSATENLTKAVVNLVHHLGVSVTQHTVADTLRTHPHFPSLAAAVAALQSWGINAEGFKIHSDLLDQLPLPCLAVVGNGHFVMLKAIADGRVTYIDPAKGWVTLPVEDFAKRWEGLILAVEPSEHAGEPDYAAQHRQERLIAWRRRVLQWGGGGMALLVLGLMGWVLRGTPVMLGLLAVKALGLALSIFLVLHHFAATRSLLRKLCPTGPRVNCTGVLQSNAALLFGWLPMADLGALYFGGGLVALLLASLNGEALLGTVWLLGLGTLLALPYTLFSVYYQARVVKQWCWLCLAVQVLFWIEFLLLQPRLFGAAPRFEAMPLVLVVVAFGLPLLLWAAIRPSLSKAVQADQWRYRYLKLLRAPGVFEALLQEKAPVPIETFSGEQQLGASAAPYALTLITHPECPPCAKTHREALRLVERYPEQVSLAIRFYCPETKSLGKDLARHVLALNMGGRPDQAQALLERWFEARPAVTVDFWREEYALPNGEALYEQADKVLAEVALWAQSVQVRGTPTVYLNARPLPANIELRDLKHLLISG